MSMASTRRRWATSAVTALMIMPIIPITSAAYADEEPVSTRCALSLTNKGDTPVATVPKPDECLAISEQSQAGPALIGLLLADEPSSAFEPLVVADPGPPGPAFEPVRLGSALQSGGAGGPEPGGGQFSDASALVRAQQVSTEAAPGSPVIPPSIGGVLTTGADLRDLDLALGDRPIYGDLLRLQNSILDMQRPVANLVARESTQSDGLNISQAELSQDLFFSEGLGRVRLGLQSALYSPKSGDSISETSVGTDGTYRINDLAAITGTFWLSNLNSNNSDGALIPTYDIFVTLWPNDYFRIDIDSSRRTFDNITSLQEHITAENLGGSVDFTPSSNYRFSVRANGSYYSDENEQESGELEFVRRVYNSPTVEIGILGTAYNFSRQLNDGYFNPKDYYSASALFRVQAYVAQRLSVEFAASGGVEDAVPFGDKPVAKASLQLVYDVGRDWVFDGGAAYFSSRESNSSGFARTSINIGIHRKF